MNNSGRVRVFLFSGLILTLMIGGITVLESRANPLLDSNISLMKTSSPTDFTEVGQEITFTFVVTNTFEYELLGVRVSDPLVEVTCPSSTLAAGSEMTCSGVYQITERDMEAGVLENQATVNAYYEKEVSGSGGCCTGGSSTDIFDVSASASLSIPRGDVPTPFIMLTKTGVPETFRWPGETISYSYRVENTGNTYIEGPVRVTDDMLDVYCPLGGLEPGQVMVCTSEYTTSEADMAAFSILNTAVADAGGGVTSTDSFEVILEAVLELSLSKSSQQQSFTEYWQLIIYDLEVTNQSNIPFDGPIEISDSLLDEWSCPEIVQFLPGNTVMCQGYYRVRQADIGNSIYNCATAHAHLANIGTYASNESCDSLPYEAPTHPCEPWPDCGE